MRASRLLSILMLLQTHGRISASTLAEKLEVSVRTVMRDIDQLSAAGVPVWTERGRDGGLRLKEGWRTNLTGLTEPEAQALLLAGLPGAALDLGLGSASASAQLKLLTALPDKQRQDALRVSSRLHLDPVDWFRVVDPAAHLQAVADAVWHQLNVFMRYESWNGVKDRTVKPLGLVLKAGFWYMAALTEAAAEPRIYKLSKIQRITVQKTNFQHPKDFNLAAFWQAATKRFEAESFQGLAKLRVSQTGFKRLQQLSTAVSTAALSSAQPDPADNNKVLVTVPSELSDFAARQLLMLGADIEVLAPTDLREKIREELNKLSKLYQK